MTTHPLLPLEQQAGASFIPYGPPAPDGSTLQMVESFGAYPAEYAAIRKSAALMSLPQRGLIRVTGQDRGDFLHNFTTNEIKKLAPGSTCRAFQLHKTGRIQADLVVLQADDCLWLDMDRCDVPATLAHLNAFLFSEDVQLEDASDRYVRLALFGPKVADALATLGCPEAGTLELAQHRIVTVAGCAGALLFRQDQTGSPGYHLWVPAAQAAPVYTAIVGGEIPGGSPHFSSVGQSATNSQEESFLCRPIGWLAFNTARIEAGSPLFHIDFGPDTLPHETGLLKEAVSFTKGCYVGQEVVGRMQNLGHPKRILVGLKGQDDVLPIAGAQVFAPSAEAGAGPSQEVIGAVTSSTLSPMLGQTAIALAMMKWGKHRAGQKVMVGAEGQLVPAVTHALKFV